MLYEINMDEEVRCCHCRCCCCSFSFFFFLLLLSACVQERFYTGDGQADKEMRDAVQNLLQIIQYVCSTVHF